MTMIETTVATQTNSRATELEGMIGPRGGLGELPSSLRPLLRKWVAAKTGKPATACLSLRMEDFQKLYRDTTDGALLDWAASPSAVAVPAPATYSTDTDALRTALQALLGKQEAAIDAERVRDIVKTELEAVRPKVTEYHFADGKPTISVTGIMHYKTPLLLALAKCRLPHPEGKGARLNALLWGPAGTGKTTTAEWVIKQVTGHKAEVLPASLTKTDVLGFVDGGGTFHSTPVTRAFTGGKGVIMDEIDSYFPAATLAANAINANGLCAIGGAMADKHEDYFCIAGANTNLMGGNSQYTRMKQDGAAADRFVFVRWDYDRALAAATIGLSVPQKKFNLAEGGIMTPEQWFNRVEAIMAACAKLKLDYVIGTRAMQYGVAMFAQGIGAKWVEEGTVFRQTNDGDMAAILAIVGKAY